MTLVRERYRGVRADGGDGALLEVLRRADQPPPKRHPLSGEPLRRIWECSTAVSDLPAPDSPEADTATKGSPHAGLPLRMPPLDLPATG
jgi:hypothetical protein